jgi:hypothetical protein
MRIFLICFDSVGEHVFEKFLKEYPNSFIAEMAREGLRFTNNYATATFTHPSYPSILYGVYPYEHGIIAGSGFHNIKTEEKNICESLEGLGWECAVFSGQNWLFEGEYGYKLPVKGTDKEIMTTKFMKDKVFLFLNYWGTHHPYEIDKDIKLSNEYSDFQKAITDGNTIAIERFKHNWITRQMQCLNRYSEILEFMHQNTTFIICSDHGDDFGFNDIPTHCGLPYDTMIKTPLIVYPYDTKEIGNTWSNIRIKEMVLRLAQGDTLDDMDLMKEAYITGGYAGPYRGAYIQSCGVIDEFGYKYVIDNTGTEYYLQPLDKRDLRKYYIDRLKLQYPFIFYRTLNEAYLERAKLDGEVKDKLESLGYA